jgi:hypothetical protein
MTSKRRFSLRPLITAIVIIACAHFVESCGFLCTDANLSPQDLIEDNDYVIVGTLVSVDTLADLGFLQYLSSEERAYIIEYTFEPMEIFKGDTGTSLIYFWCCISIRLMDGYYNAPECDSAIQLIYGNEILDSDSLIHIYTPNLVWKGDVLVLRDWITGKPPETQWASATGDSTLMARIMESTHLEPILTDRNQKGRVIYGTEEGYYTHYSFCSNDLVYCNHLWSFPKFVDPSSYVKKLRSLSR